jgi:hypothetical protein
MQLFLNAKPNKKGSPKTAFFYLKQSPYITYEILISLAPFSFDSSFLGSVIFNKPSTY